MDVIKKRLITDNLIEHGLDHVSIKKIMRNVEHVVDSEYKSGGGVIGEFETWACFFANDKMYKITHTTNEFVVQPLEKVDE